MPQAKVGEKGVLSDGKRALKAAIDEDGQPRVMLPQMIMAKFTEMLTGKAPKDEALTRRRRKEATALASSAKQKKTIKKQGAPHELNLGEGGVRPLARPCMCSFVRRRDEWWLG